MIIENKNRNNLSEGRRYELGFAFLKREAANRYIEVMPRSTCKDYLNDVVIAEKYGKEYPPVYGFSYTPMGLFKNRQLAYMSISMLDYKSPYSSWQDYDKFVKLLNKNYLNMQYYINSIEEALGIKKRTKLIKKGDNLIVSHFSKKWVDQTYLISLYSFLFRIAIYCDDKIAYTDFKKDFIQETSVGYTYKNYKDRLDKLIKRGIFNNLDIDESSSIDSVHSNGFFSLNF
jgi:hypothetical protein